MRFLDGLRCPPLILAVSFAAGAVPFSNLAARATAGVDLRSVGEGTVSGTGLYHVAGFGPLAVAGLADVAKGALGPLLAGRRRPVIAAAAASAGVGGHNWSPFLRGAGGRGISVAIGALTVRHWRGAAVLLTGLAAGRLVMDQAGFGGFVADLALIPVLWRSGGGAGLLMAVAVIVPMFAKRLTGNRAPVARVHSALVHRLLFDRDPGRQWVERQ